MRKTRLRKRCAHAAIGALLLATTACSGEVSARVSPSTSDVDPDYAALLPASIRHANLIRIGADASTPPYLFVNKDGELEGLEFDFMQALSDEIGVPIQVVATSFSGLVPSL